MTEYYSHPRIAQGSVERREYQISIAEACLKTNTLAILPTGMGKTIIAVIVAAETLRNGGRVLVLAPTRPLVDQHHDSFERFLIDTDVGVMNGYMSPENRTAMMASKDVVISTPQAVANDLDAGRYGLDDFSLIIYDEAHRGTGNYAYVSVAARYGKGRSVGLTASPGSDPKKIEEVCLNLSLYNIEMRSEEDPDVSPYVHDIFVNRIEVNMPQDLVDIVTLFKKLLDRYVADLIAMRLMEPNWPPSIKHLLVVGETLRKRMIRGEKSNIIFRGMVTQSVCIKLQHAIGLAETQGVSALKSYMIKLDEEIAEGGSKGTRELVSSKEYKDAWALVSTTKVEHPKISRVMSLVSKELASGRGGRILVFCQYRDTCDLMESKLRNIDGARVAKLIGQSNGGLKQKDQIELLSKFKDGTYNVLVSTSVGEEGLDVASTDMVVFYEPVPSEIRTIQRRGRTGRKNDGDVYVLVAKGTMDEVSENTSKRKEEQMRAHLEKLNAELRKRSPASGSQKRLGEY